MTIDAYARSGFEKVSFPFGKSYKTNNTPASALQICKV